MPQHQPEYQLDSTDNESEIDDIQMFQPNSVLYEAGPGSKPEDIDAMIARELAQLSMEDREKVYSDLHGVAEEVKETPQLIQESLMQFESALDKIHEKKGYDTAKSLGASYVLNPDFRLRFLRADCFDVTKAADRFVKHFEAKLELFGANYLCQDLTQEDLNAEDLDLLYGNSGFDLPFRDQAGRLVIFKNPEISNNTQAKLRRMFYAGMVVSEDEETQKKGAIVVACIIGQYLSLEKFLSQRRRAQDVWKLEGCMPLRIVGLHLCTDSRFWRMNFALIRLASSQAARVRTREHFGNWEQIRLSLRTFGVPVDHLPVSNTEAVKEAASQRWRKRKILERAKSNADSSVRVEAPGSNDVLLGRGKASYTHSGNVAFRRLVLERALLYDKAHFLERAEVSKVVLKLIKEKSGRFLKEDASGWIEVDEETALKKVSHAFRHVRSQRKASELVAQKLQAFTCNRGSFKI